jgi:hypothetical protein
MSTAHQLLPLDQNTLTQRQPQPGGFLIYPLTTFGATIQKVPAIRVEDQNLSEAQVASLRRALERDFGPSLSEIHVYVGPKGGFRGMVESCG